MQEPIQSKDQIPEQTPEDKKITENGNIENDNSKNTNIAGTTAPQESQSIGNSSNNEPSTNNNTSKNNKPN